MRRISSRRLHQTTVAERRSGIDRRRKKKIDMRALLFGGRRKTIRRQEDRRETFLVDQYQQSLFGIVALILFFSVIDAILTLFLINHGAIEVNPVMAFYLNLGPYVFLGVKYGLTSVGLLILIVFKDMFLRPVQMRTGVVFYIILAAFVGVISWQIFLIHKVII